VRALRICKFLIRRSIDSNAKSMSSPFLSEIKPISVMSSRLNHKGITIIELVIVMVIIAIGAVLMVPNIGAWLPNYRLRSATRDIVSTLRTAQMKAVSTQMNYQVSFDPGKGSYILRHNSGGAWFDEGGAQTLPSGILISMITFPDNKAQFDPHFVSSGGSITLQNPKGTERRITLSNATGRVNIN